ncbi:MAG: DUF6491 family protein [Rhodanobacter sp.]
MWHFRYALAGVACSLLVACSSVPYAQRVQARQAAYNAAAGAPVTHFNFSSLYSWESLGDTQLAVYTRPNTAWLLDVPPYCPQLDYRNTIALTSKLNQVSINFDKVLTGSPIACTIKQIRPVDVGRLRVLQQEQHKIESKPRPVQSGTVGVGD